MTKRKHSTGPEGRKSNRRDPQRQRGRPDGAQGGARDSCIWLYGVHSVLAALGNPGRICRRLLMTRQVAENLKSRLAGLESGLRAEMVDKRDIETLLPAGAVHQGVAVLAEPLVEVSLEDICQNPSESSIVVVLDQATDPHNVGAVLRSAAAFGAAAVIMQDRHAPGTQGTHMGTLAKAASGALESVPLVRVTNITRAMEGLKKARYWCIGLDAEAGESLAGAGLSGRTALILGSEGEGLRRLVRENCDRLLRIPITGMESLNLSNAAAIALYEASR